MEAWMEPRGYPCVGLVSPKSDVNVAAALRACGVYNVAFLAIAGRRYKRHSADTRNAYKHIPLLRVGDLKDVVPYDCVPVAVDLVEGAVPLPEYEHPERAFYVFGPEDGTLGRATTGWCRDTVYVPSSGCMNLAACVNVLLYDRLAKRGTPPR